VTRDRRTITLRGALYGDEHSCVSRVYIIVHEPGLIPEKKMPRQTDEGVTEFLVALQMHHSEDTTYTVVQLVWNGDIWVQSGSEWLDMARLAAPRKFAALKRRVAEEQKRLKAA